MTSRETPWKSITVESVAIVASILLAFAIDAWWDDRQESRSDRAHLAAVLSELKRHRDLLEESVAAHQATTVAGSEILEYISSEGAKQPEQGLAVTLSRLVNFYQINAPFGALETAMLAGAIPRMSNNDLAARLANWPVAIEDLLEEQNQGFELMFALLSTLSERLPLADVYREKLGTQTIRGTGEVFDLEVLEPADSPFRFNPGSILESYEVENELLLFMVLAQSSKAEAASFLGELDGLINQLGSCLQSASC